MPDELGWNRIKQSLFWRYKSGHALHKSAVLSLTGDETQDGSQRDGVRPRVLDGTVHPNERSIPEAGKKRIKEKLFQSHEQLSVRQDNGELSKESEHQNRPKQRKKRDSQADCESFIRRL